MRIAQRALVQRRGVTPTWTTATFGQGPRAFGVRAWRQRIQPASRWRSTALAMRTTLALASVSWTDFGEMIRLHTPVDYSGSVTHFHEAILRTRNAAAIAYARLFNITDNIEVAGSQVGTNSTSTVRVRSGGFSLPTLPKEYRAQIGE